MSNKIRWYRALMRLYPRSYRRDFESQMLQTFVDWHDDVVASTGRTGVRFWMSVVADELRNVIGQHRAAGVPVSMTGAPERIVAFSALLAALFVLLTMSIARPARAQEGLRPLGIDALIGMNTLSYWGIGSLSPDGALLVYAVREGSRLRSNGDAAGESQRPAGPAPGRTNLYLADTRTGKQERMSDNDGQYQQPLWSPDGSHVAFYSDRDGVMRVWVWELATRQMRKLADDRVHPSSFAHLRWTPDSKSVVVLLASESTPSQPSAGRPSDAPAMQATDSTIASGATVRVYRAEPVMQNVARSATGIDTVTVDTVSLWGAMDADLAVMRVADGRVTRLALQRPLFWYDPSPDGQWVAFSRQSAIVRGVGQPMYDYEMIHIDGGEVRTVARRARSGTGTASWSPDSRTLAYIELGPLVTGDIHLVDVATARSRKLTTAPHPPLMAEGATPHWSADGQHLFVALNGQLWKAPVSGSTLSALAPPAWGKRVVAVVTDAAGRVHSGNDDSTLTVATHDPATRHVGFHRLHASTGAAARLREEPRRFGGGRWPAIASADGSTIVYMAEDDRQPADLWVGSADLADVRRLTMLNPAISNASLGRAEVVEYTNANGDRLQGVLIYPGDYEPGKRYPLIVRVYPGPFRFRNNVHVFGLDGATGIQNMQMYASRGYAVLMPEIPQQLGTPVHSIVDGVNAAVDRVIEMGVADPARLGITGQSYGGYATIAMLTRSTRFKGALMSASIPNLLDVALQLRPESGTDLSFWTEGGQGLMGGTVWDHKERYIENSPVMHLDRVHTPVLIVHGEKDDAFPVTLSDQVFVGLRRLGRVAEYRRYAGEGHVISSAENVTDYWRAAIRWFDQYVRDAQ